MTKSADKNPNAGHRGRLRERYKKVGFSGLSEHEVLELLLYYAIPQKDTKLIAKALLEHFGSLSNVLDAGEEQLTLAKIKGLTPNSVTLLTMLVPLIHEYSHNIDQRVVLNTAEDSGRYLIKYYQGINKERVTVTCIDAKCRVLTVEPVCEGDCNSVVLNCRRIVEIVLKFPLTRGIIIAHNHPSGLALPSRDDIATTSELIKILKNVNIDLIDHVIVANDDYVSLSTSPVFKNVFKYF